MTDTNQASEYELEQKVDTIVLAGWRYGRQKEEVLELIRTEKLKLLAEVRERVVGEDELYARVKDGIRIVGQSEKPRNELRTDQRIELTKLEADL